jgi:hypothetical protein
MIRNLKDDLRTLEWSDMAEIVSLGGFICSVFIVVVIWSGNLP